MGLFDGLPSGWAKATDQSGRTYYFNTDTGESQWTPPAAMAQKAPQPVRAPQQVVLTPREDPRATSPGADDEDDRRSRTGGGSAFQKINIFLQSKHCCGPKGCCAAFARCLEPDEGPLTNAVITRAFWGAIFYGILFVPFVFALLQQTMIDHKAIDPFNPMDSVSPSAWGSGFVFLFAIDFLR